MTERFRITSDPLDERAVAEGLSTSEDGAVVVFSGIVRARNKGRKVLHLEYEAYEAMVYPVFERVAEDVSRRFGVERLRTAGRPFDARTMHAAEVRRVAGTGSGMVVEELLSGYTRDGDILRLAEVAVNRNERQE